MTTDFWPENIIRLLQARTSDETLVVSDWLEERGYQNAAKALKDPKEGRVWRDTFIDLITVRKSWVPTDAFIVVNRGHVDLIRECKKRIEQSMLLMSAVVVRPPTTRPVRTFTIRLEKPLGQRWRFNVTPDTATGDWMLDAGIESDVFATLDARVQNSPVVDDPLPHEPMPPSGHVYPSLLAGWLRTRLQERFPNDVFDICVGSNRG